MNPSSSRGLEWYGTGSWDRMLSREGGPFVAQQSMTTWLGVRIRAHSLGFCSSGFPCWVENGLYNGSGLKELGC